MPDISFFADEMDAPILVKRLNEDPEIAFIVPDGPLDPEVAYTNRLLASLQGKEGATFYGPFGVIDDGYRQRWKAVQAVDNLKDGQHSLWHIPAGALPLLAMRGPDRAIPNPWKGWTERGPGADRTTPYFGPGHHAEIRLELWTRHRPYSRKDKKSLPVLISYWDRKHDILVASSFQWIGGHYAPPPLQTKRWWNRLRAWFKRSATRLADGPVSFWAFPSALEKLKSGMEYEARGWDLSKSIRMAKARARPKRPEV